MDKRPNISSVAFMSVFLIMISLPGLLFLFGYRSDNSELEKSAKTTLSEFEFSSEYQNKFENYFKENYGLKDELIQVNGFVQLGLFNSTIKPEMAVMGNDGWFFYNSKTDKIRDSYLKTDLLSSEELSDEFNQWEINWQKNQFDGKEYLRVCWPNKHSIYPSKMPSGMRISASHRLSRLDQSLEYNSKRNSPLPFYSVTSDLIEAERNYQIYRKHDTHWNQLGAYFAYNSFLTQSKKFLKVDPIPLTAFETTWIDSSGGDLISFQGLESVPFLSDLVPEMHYNFNYVEIEAKDLPTNSIVTINKNSECELEILVFRDSYMGQMIPFFSEHFRKVTYVWFGYNQEVVDLVNPDVVIDAKVERYLFE